jgi:hypothetical protein
MDFVDHIAVLARAFMNAILYSIYFQTRRFEGKKRERGVKGIERNEERTREKEGEAYFFE